MPHPRRIDGASESVSWLGAKRAAQHNERQEQLMNFSHSFILSYPIASILINVPNIPQRNFSIMSVTRLPTAA
jgi:hypothetical protein